MQQHLHTRNTNWGDLPCELLRSIAKNLKQFSDFCNFKSVCKKWYYSLSISVLLPFSDYASHSSTLFSSSILLLHPHAHSPTSSSTPTPWMVSSVEIIKGNMQLLHPFFQTPFPNQINLDDFHFSVLAQSYHIAPSNNLNCASSLSAVDKVLVFSDHRVPSIDDCSLLVLHNGRLGGYPSSNQEDDPHWVDVSYHGVDDFDDIINFKGLIYAVDWQGKLYQISNDQISVEKTLVSFVISNAGAYNGWRKRLVGSSLDENLYLVVREIDKFKVYMLSNRGKMGVWIKVQSFGDEKQVLFLSRVYGFFAKSSNFPGRQLGNCIVFSDDAFPMYSFRGWVYQMDVQSEEEIKIFRLGVGVGLGVRAFDGWSSNFQPILSCPNFPIMLWTPPPWISQAPPGFRSPLDQRNFISKDNMFPYRNSMGNEMQHDSHKASVEPERSVPARVQIDTGTPHVVQPVEKGVSVTPKFQGIDVHTDHLPILEKVWAKHGDVVKGIKLHSSDFLATTLTALAKLILILQTNTGKTLTDDRANYLTSTMSDLLSLGVNVEWLVPFVEKASALHQRKSLEAALLELEKAKAKVEEMNRSFVAKMAEMSQRCKREPEDAVGMLASEIDPDKLVGEGLL